MGAHTSQSTSVDEIKNTYSMQHIRENNVNDEVFNLGKHYNIVQNSNNIGGSKVEWNNVDNAGVMCMGPNCPQLLLLL